MTVTPFLRLQKPPFDSIPWDAAINGDMDIIDGAMAQFLSIPNFSGSWVNAFVYGVGQIALDVTNSIMYVCNVSHTSSSYPTTFAQDRANHPTYWANATNVPSDWAAQAKASADAADISEANAAASEIAAAGSASSAAGSATSAGNSASSASTSATNAANSATASQNWYKQFIGTYYGPYATAPVVDPNGAAPTLGDLYFNTTANVMQEWTSTGWQGLASGAGSGGTHVTVSDTPPIGPVNGDLWFDSASCQLYVSYYDGNSQQWVVTINAVVGSNAATQNDVAMAQNNVGRNKLHNGLFTINQRGLGGYGANTTGWTYSLDRWMLILAVAGDSLSHTLTTMTDAYRAQIGDESATTGNACNFTGGAGAANACLTGQFIEGVRRLAGKTVIVSFYALAAASSPKLGVSLDQYFGSGGSPSATVSGTGQSVTVSSVTWARYSVTLTLPSVSGKTLGTAGNDQTSLLFWHSAGANNATRSGNVGVQSGTHIIWGCQLEIAAPGQTQPTPLEKLDPRIELSNCQRFYQLHTQIFLEGYGPTGNALIQEVMLPTVMRAAPSVIFSNPTYNSASGISLNIAYPSHVRATYTLANPGNGIGWAAFDLQLSADL